MSPPVMACHAWMQAGAPTSGASLVQLRRERVVSKGDVARLVAASRRGRFGEMWRQIEAERHKGLTVGQIHRELIEPAARALGDAWRWDECARLELTVGMGMLLLVVRRLGPAARGERAAAIMARSALVTTTPGEPHTLAAALVSASFLAKGWDVAVCAPESRQHFLEEVSARWDDVVVACSSPALIREGSIDTIARWVRGARMASRNPSLVVLASGRVFVDEPSASKRASADAAIVSPSRAAALAESLLRRRPTMAREVTRALLRGVVVDALREIAARHVADTTEPTV